MHLLDNVSADETVADVGLIGDDDDDVSMFLQRLDGSRRVWNEPEIIESPGSVGSAGAHQRAAQHAVTVQENGWSHRYHFVGCLCSFGCDTRQCQTTAWNASE
jgi:hypothetical protein